MKCLDFYFRSIKGGPISLHQRNFGFELCEACGEKRVANFKITYIFTAGPETVYRCNLCISILYVKEKITKIKGYSYINILKNIDIKEIPKYILYEIGEKGLIDDHLLISESIATYNKTCNLARRAIREFCLYCIRYEKDKVNRDIRRKISQLIWEDKIKFQILLYSFSSLMRLIFSYILHNQSFRLCTCHQWSRFYFA